MRRDQYTPPVPAGQLRWEIAVFSLRHRLAEKFNSNARRRCAETSLSISRYPDCL
jgi:hypothetical protein